MPRRSLARRRILVVDIGGTHVKAYLSGHSGILAKFPSGPSMTPLTMTRGLRRALGRTPFDVATIGYPGPVRRDRILKEPANLGRGWVGFDFARALESPVRVVNDAVIQALGSYEGGRMLFLGLGSGLGSALVVDGVAIPMELAHLPYRKGRSYEQMTGEAARRRLGRKRWQKEVERVVELFRAALEPDYVVIGGGNVRRLRRLPAGARRGSNRLAFLGGLRVWQGPDELAPRGEPSRRRRRKPG